MEDIKLIKEALAYSLGSDLHEEWRKTRLKEDGTYEPRMKKSTDEEWNSIHGTDDVDIANSSFKELPSNWQFENLEAAKVAIGLVYDKTILGEDFIPFEVELMARDIHNEWLKRNDWVFHLEYGNPNLVVPYEELTIEEQDKDKAQISVAYAKVKKYMICNIDIQDICDEYKLLSNTKSL